MPDMGQAVWSAAAAQEHHRQALDQQQQQQQHGRVSEGQQMSQHPATAPQQGHSHMGLEQQTAHLQQHLVQQLQGGDTASLQPCSLLKWRGRTNMRWLAGCMQSL